MSRRKTRAFNQLGEEIRHDLAQLPPTDDSLEQATRDLMWSVMSPMSGDPPSLPPTRPNNVFEQWRRRWAPKG